MNKTSLWVLSCAVVGFSAVTQAELTPDEISQRTYIQEKLDENIARSNEYCGMKATIKLDWDSLKAQNTSDRNLTDYCSDNVVSEMKNLCSEGDVYKKHMAKVKKVTCRYGAANKASYAAGTFSYQFSWNRDGGGQVVNQALRNMK